MRPRYATLLIVPAACVTLRCSPFGSASSDAAPSDGACPSWFSTGFADADAGVLKQGSASSGSVSLADGALFASVNLPADAGSAAQASAYRSVSRPLPSSGPSGLPSLIETRYTLRVTELSLFSIVGCTLVLLPPPGVDSSLSVGISMYPGDGRLSAFASRYAGGSTPLLPRPVFVTAPALGEDLPVTLRLAPLSTGRARVELSVPGQFASADFDFQDTFDSVELRCGVPYADPSAEDALSGPTRIRLDDLSVTMCP